MRVEFRGAMDLAVSETGTLVYTDGGVFGIDRQMVWVTRDGTTEEVDPGWIGDFRWPRLSPDGAQLAVTMIVNDEVDLWIKRLDRGPLRKLTFGGAVSHRPAWRPDGQSVAFLSARDEDSGVYVRRLDETDPAKPLVIEERMQSVAYSPDGKWLIYGRGPSGGRSIYGLAGDSGSAVAMVATEHDEIAPAVSPDGRWLAYVSNESGRYEIYVRPFPNTQDSKWTVSIDGGQEPVWAHSGRELFYKGSGSLMVVDVMPGADFVMGDRRALFQHAQFRSSLNHQQYDVGPDDQRFMMVSERRGGKSDELIVVENFFEELKAKVGN